jgi:hypothetical protein
MTRRSSGSVARRLGWLEQARYHARRIPSRVEPTFPMCLQCNEPVDKVEHVDGNAKQLWVRGHHHGKEDVVRVDFEYEMDDEDMQRAFRSLSFFPRTSEQDGAR